MNTETLLKFFTSKLEAIPELRNLTTYRDPKFNTWWNTVKSTCERMGATYKQRADRIRFFPGMVVGGQDNTFRYTQAYLRGLDDAEAFMKAIIEELEMWGYGSDSTMKHDSSQGLGQEKVVLNLTISQQQVQQITQTINLSQYDEDVQAKVQELLDELKKESKDKSKIIETVKWLTDKGADALIAVLLAATHLT